MLMLFVVGWVNPLVAIVVGVGALVDLIVYQRMVDDFFAKLADNHSMHEV